MTVHVIYRSYGGENMKNRPGFYSKLLALASCVRAAQAAGVSLTFLNDGPIPADRLALMRESGEVLTLNGSGGMRASYLAALRWATSQRFADSDVVWFSEDDYLYDPDAFLALERLARERPGSTNYALYGFSGEGDDGHYSPPKGWDPQRITVGGDAWKQIDSTTSTFGLRVGTLHEDFGIFRLCMLPHRRQLRDHDTCLVYQGYEPYTWRELLQALVLLAPGSPRERLRQAVFSPFFIATNLRSHRPSRHRRVLLSPAPNLATHLETDLMAEGRDWARIAVDTEDWLTARHSSTEVGSRD